MSSNSVFGGVGSGAKGGMVDSPMLFSSGQFGPKDTPFAQMGNLGYNKFSSSRL